MVEECIPRLSAHDACVLVVLLDQEPNLPGDAPDWARPSPDVLPAIMVTRRNPNASGKVPALVVACVRNRLPYTTDICSAGTPRRAPANCREAGSGAAMESVLFRGACSAGPHAW